MNAVAPISDDSVVSWLLVVDDIAENRDLLKRRFERSGYRVDVAASGADALGALDRRSYSAVLLDMMMPGMDGLEVLARMRENPAHSGLPVIMVTARTDGQDVAQAIEAGANDYITKPVDFAAALARVRAQLARSCVEQSIKQENGELVAQNSELGERRSALELEVAARTKSLTEANQQLQTEISQRKAAQKHAEYLATHDSLTGLKNRAAFEEELNHCDLPHTALLFLDLDGFKIVNDTAGHAAGDQVLTGFGMLLSTHVRDGQSVFRYGGDEFCILWQGEEMDVEGFAQEIIAALEHRDFPAAEGHRCSVSIGIVLGEAGLKPQVLLQRADVAMYRAKLEGKGCFRSYDGALDASVLRRYQLEADLRSAFKRRKLEVYFQPILTCQDSRLSGFEALCRWPTAEGFIPPSEFIHVAEESLLIVEIGAWVLKEACREAATWPGDLRVAVNVSPIQFRCGDLVALVASTLKETGLEPRRLELEITESVRLADNVHNAAALHALEDIGVRISLDDFGTGYSSLSYLRSFRFDKVKIDRSFVTEMIRDKTSEAIVRAVTDIGAAFGLTTTAEGVETLEQLAFLRKHNCTEVQGYLFSPPVPQAEVQEMIRADAQKE